MLIAKIVLATTCGAALATSTVAQEQSATFEYWPIARHLRSGQFQAEVWRHDRRNGYSDLAWSNQESFATPTIAMANACSSVQSNFDASFSCSDATHRAPASDREAVNHESAPPAKKIAVTAVESRGVEMKAPTHPAPIAKVPVGSDERRAWLKDFWKIGGK
jgi:hypothetical protein